LFVEAIKLSVVQTAVFHLNIVLILWRNNYYTYCYLESGSGTWM